MSRRRRGCWRWPGSTPARCNAARIGRSISRRRRRWRATAARASALHNNCSGKHAGFLCVACALDADRAHYVRADHPVQRAVKAALEEPDRRGARRRMSAPSTAARCRPGRCRSRRWRAALPASAPARAWRPSAPRRRRGCAPPAPRIPGTSPAPAGSAPRSCSASARACSSRPAPRASIARRCPEQGLGIAVKCDDGAGRAAEVMMAAMLARFLPDA